MSVDPVVELFVSETEKLKRELADAQTEIERLKEENEEQAFELQGWREVFSKERKDEDEQRHRREIQRLKKELEKVKRSKERMQRLALKYADLVLLLLDCVPRKSDEADDGGV